MIKFIEKNPVFNLLTAKITNVAINTSGKNRSIPRTNFKSINSDVLRRHTINKRVRERRKEITKLTHRPTKRKMESKYPRESYNTFSKLFIIIT